MDAEPSNMAYAASSSIVTGPETSNELSLYHSLTAASLTPGSLNMAHPSQLEFPFPPNDSFTAFSASQLGAGLENTGTFSPGMNITSGEGYSPGGSAHPSHYMLSPIDEQPTSSVPMFTDIAWRPDESLDQRYQQPLELVTTPAQISAEAPPQRVLHFLRPGQITLPRRQSAPACSLPLMPGENPPFRLDGPPPLLPSHLSIAVTSPPPASPSYIGQPQLDLAEEPHMTFQRVGDKRKGLMQIAESNIVRHNTCFTSGPETRSYGAEGGWSSVNYANTRFGM